MNRLKYLVIGILALFLAGCGNGQVVVETLNVAKNPATYNAPASGKSIVILPFADYSQGNLESAQRRNMIITESLTDRLITNGFTLPIQEDVLAYLRKENIIGNGSSSLEVEVQNIDYSDTMKSQLRTYMEESDNQIAQGNSPGTHGLSTQTVAKIGQYFGVDYVIRGRILEYKGTVGKLENEATVQMRIWAQEAATGSVVWSNRINVTVSPESIAADDQLDNLSNRAIQQGVTTLVDDFVMYGI